MASISALKPVTSTQASPAQKSAIRQFQIEVKTSVLPMQVEPKTGREVDRRALGIAFRTSIEPSIDLATRRGEMWLSFTF